MKEPLTKKSVSLPAWVWAQLSSYQHTHGCISQSDALRRILVDRFGAHELPRAPASRAAGP